MTIKHILLYRGKDNQRTEKVIETINNWCEENGFQLTEVTNQQDIHRIENREIGKTMLFSLGGDGTFLQAADLIAPHRIPILGINLGELGFLTELGSTDLEENLKEISEGKSSIRELSRLNCQFKYDNSKEGTSFTALNEVTITRGATTGLAELELYLDSKKVATYPGDGLIVSTPTGSTAYSLSCGGPLITRNTAAFSITPLNVHKLGLRPIICSDQTEIEIRNNTPVSLQIDGKETGDLEKDNLIKIGKSETPTMVVLPDSRSNFFETVRSKLNWDKDRGSRT